MVSGDMVGAGPGELGHTDRYGKKGGKGKRHQEIRRNRKMGHNGHIEYEGHSPETGSLEAGNPHTDKDTNGSGGAGRYDGIQASSERRCAEACEFDEKGSSRNTVTPWDAKGADG